MDASMHVGATVVDAPPGTPGGTHARRITEDRATLDAVRAGDIDAFGALYSRHGAAVRRLARRMATDRYEADDIVSDVFANTLRAIRNGRGPRDDAQAYLLRAVRHTTGKLRSRKDTGRSEPVPVDRLDRAVDTDVHLRSDVEIALTNLPDRHRDVLWATCVEGRPASEVAAAGGLDTTCVTSLALRARRALGRSYLLQRTARPEPTDQCRRMRTSMPGCLRDEVSTSTATSVYQHIDGCEACREVYDEMSILDHTMCSITVVGLAIAIVRGWLRFGAPLAATLAKPLTSIAVVGAFVTGAIAIEPPVTDSDAEVSAGQADSGSHSGSITLRRWSTAALASDAIEAVRRRLDESSANDPFLDSSGTAHDDVPTGAVPVHSAAADAGDLRPDTNQVGPLPLALEVPPLQPTTVGDLSTDEIVEPVTTVLDDVVDDLVDDVGESADLSQHALTVVGGTVDEVVGEVVDEVVDEVVELVGTATETVDDVTTQLTTEVTGATAPVDGLVDDVVGTVVDDVLDPLPLATPQGGDVLGAVGDLTDDTGDALFGIVGGGLGLLGD